MTKEELKIWFFNKFDNCYPLHKNDKIFMYYNTNFIRAKKLANILDKDISFPEKNQVLLFVINDNQIYCDYNLIWCFLRDNNHFYFSTTDMIRVFLSDSDKYKHLYPSHKHLTNI